MINYSIIIPHKNIPDLLRRCLDSIPRREDVQIIVVDDNSNPAVLDFNCFPGLDEPCVEVYFTKEGKGAGYARNVGLEHAVGKWVLFADADDFFSLNLLDKLDTYKDVDAEIIVFRWEIVKSDMFDLSRRFGPISLKEIESAIRGEMPVSLYLSALNMPWSKMVLHRFLTLHDIHFEESYVANDVLYSKLLAVYAKRIILAKEILYMLTDRDERLGTDFSSEACMIRYDVLSNVNKYLRTIKKSEYEQPLLYLEYRAYNSSYWTYVRLFFRALHDSMLSAGRSIRMERYRILHKKQYKFIYLYALYLLLGGPTLRNWFRKLRIFCKLPPYKLEIHLAEHCNLNCVGCSHYSPLASHAFCNIEQLEENLQKLAPVQNMFSIIRLLGGEPLLHPKIVDAFRIVRKYCKDSEIQLVTNGIRLSEMPDEFWKACVQYDITIALTIYPIAVNYVVLKTLCLDHGVKFRLYGNKKNSGFTRLQLIERGTGHKYNYYLCGSMSTCMQLVGSRIYPCSQCAYVKYLNHAFDCKFQHKNGDFVSVDKLSHYRLIWFVMHPKPFCKYCDVKGRQRIEWSLSKRKKSEWIIER